MTITTEQAINGDYYPVTYLTISGDYYSVRYLTISRDYYPEGYSIIYSVTKPTKVDLKAGVGS